MDFKQQEIIFEGFKIIDRLGKGAFGSVYLAKKDEKLYALKMISKSYMKDRPFLQKYIRNESESMKSIQCENCVKLYDYFETNLAHFFAMEYCDQGNLFNLLHARKGQGLPENEALIYFSQILNGLKTIHEKGYMHRDLKPENILIHNNIAKICDFGFARPLAFNELTSTVCGTTEYMPPELLKQQPYNYKADIWALGVLLFIMVFGHLPFYGQSIFGMIERQCKNKVYDVDKWVEKFPKSSEIAKTLSLEIKDFFSKIFVYDPLQRIDYLKIMQHPLIEKMDGPQFAYLNKKQSKIFYSTKFEENEKSSIKTYNQLEEEQLNSTSPNISIQVKKEEDKVERLNEKKKILKTIIETSEKTTLSNQDDEALTIDFQDDDDLYYIDSTIRQSSVANRLQYILYYNKQLKSSYKKLLEFYDYEIDKYGFLQNTMECLSHELSSQQQLSCYFLSKAWAYYAHRMVLSLTDKDNIFNIPESDWKGFLSSEEYLQLMNRVLQDEKQASMHLVKNYMRLENDKQGLEGVVPQVKEISFEEFKFPYRKSLMETFNSLADLHKKIYSLNKDHGTRVYRIAMKILLCYFINRVFNQEEVKSNLALYFESTQQTSFDFNQFYNWANNVGRVLASKQVKQVLDVLTIQ